MNFHKLRLLVIYANIPLWIAVAVLTLVFQKYQIVRIVLAGDVVMLIGLILYGAVRGAVRRAYHRLPLKIQAAIAKMRGGQPDGHS